MWPVEQTIFLLFLVKIGHFNECNKSCFLSGINESFTTCKFFSCQDFPDHVDVQEATSLQLENNNVSVIPIINLPHLQYLDVSFNRVRRIEKAAFGKCGILKVLILTGNLLDYLTVEMIFGLDSLQRLHLRFNLLTTVHRHVFSQLRVLEELDLSANKLSSIEPSAFSGLDNLKTLDLRKNYLTSVKSSYFTDLSSLTDLRLSDNKIKDVEDGSFADCRSLRILDLSRGNIDSLRPHTFDGLQELRVLNMSDNSLQILRPGTLGFQNLEELALDYNPISSIYPGAFPANLVLLSLRGTRLEVLREGTFMGLHHLLRIDLSNNTDLHKVELSSFDGSASSVVELDLSNNNLRQLHIDLLHWKNIEVLKLSGNNWVCDCEMRWLLLEVNISDIWKSTFRCSEPSHLAGTILTDLSEEDLICFPETSYVFTVGFVFAFLAACVFFSVCVCFMCKHRRKICFCYFDEESDAGYERASHYLPLNLEAAEILVPVRNLKKENGILHPPAGGKPSEQKIATKLGAANGVKYSRNTMDLLTPMLDKDSREKEKANGQSKKSQAEVKQSELEPKVVSSRDKPNVVKQAPRLAALKNEARQFLTPVPPTSTTPQRGTSSSSKSGQLTSNSPRFIVVSVDEPSSAKVSNNDNTKTSTRDKNKTENSAAAVEIKDRKTISNGEAQQKVEDVKGQKEPQLSLKEMVAARRQAELEARHLLDEAKNIKPDRGGVRKTGLANMQVRKKLLQSRNISDCPDPLTV